MPDVFPKHHPFVFRVPSHAWMVSRLGALFGKTQAAQRPRTQPKPVAKEQHILKKQVPRNPKVSKVQRPSRAANSAAHLWQKFGKKWQAGPGSHVSEASRESADSLERRHVWLQYRSGGMGCSVCAWFAERVQDEKPKDRQRRYATKWSKFAIKSSASMQSSCIRAHAQSVAHQTAWKAFCNPQQLRTIVRQPLEDCFLQKGGVPQWPDWLRLWRAIKGTNLSLRGLEQLSWTDSFASCERVDCKAISREAWKQMVEVFSDIVRAEKREALRRSVAICISTDDKSYTFENEVFLIFSGHCPFCFSQFFGTKTDFFAVFRVSLSGPWRDVSYQACLSDGTVCRGVVRALGLKLSMPGCFFVLSSYCCPVVGCDPPASSFFWTGCLHQ